ncbi:phosphatase PAP2 family protein [Sinomonas atrocyanea]
MTYPDPALRSEGPAEPRMGSRLAVLPSLRHWIIASAALTAIVFLLGFLVTAPAVSDAELPVDQAFSAHHVHWLDTVSLGIEHILGPAGAVVIVLAVMAFLWLVRRTPVDALAVGSVTGFGWVFSLLFKYTVNRQRPDQHLLAHPLSAAMDPKSFPSGHVCLAVSLTIALYFLFRHRRSGVWVLVAGLAVTFLVALSRVYVGVHYPTDVIASIPASLAGIILWCGLWNRFAPPLIARVPLIGRLEAR